MPRGVYNRSTANPRRRRRRVAPKSQALSVRIERLSKELAALGEQVRQAEGLKLAIDAVYAANGASPKRRGRPPGSKNKASNGRRRRSATTSSAASRPKRRRAPA